MKNIINETPEDIEYIGRLAETFRFIDSKDFTAKKVLDIGCGYGWFEKKILELAPEKIIGIEVSETDLGTIKSHLKSNNLELSVGSAIDIPYDDNTFDTVVSWEVLEHIPKNTETKMFCEISRVLKRGGVCYISTPYRGFFSTILDPAWWISGHRHYTKQAIRKFAEASDMTIEKIIVKGGGWSILSLLNLYFSKWILRRPRMFQDFFAKQVEKDYSKKEGTVDMFIKLTKL